MKKLTLIASGTICCFLIFLGWAVSGMAFLGDDWGHVGLVAAGLGEIWTTSWAGERLSGGYYRPITETSLYLDWLLFGLRSSGFHLGNLAMHAVCSALTVLVGRRLFGQGDVRSIGVGLLFLVLPIHASSVFWVVGRGDMLCTLFYLAAIVVLPTRRSILPGPMIAAVAVVSLSAFLSKEMAFTLPIALAIVAWHERTLKVRTVQWALAGSGAALVVCLALRYSVLGSLSGGVVAPSVSEMLYDILRAGGLLGYGNVKIFGIAVLVVTAAFGLLVRFDWRSIVPLVCLAGVVLVPALGRLHRWYLYLPSVFFVLIVVEIWLKTVPANVRIREGAFAVLVVYYAAALGGEALKWRETGELSETYLDKTAAAIGDHGGRAVLLNVPSAYDGVPMFAHNLEPALRLRDVGADDLVIANHVWLLDPSALYTVVSNGEGRFSVSIEDAIFSFHRSEALTYDASGSLAPQTVQYDWGRVSYQSETSATIEISPITSDDVVLSYDGSGYQTYEPNE